MCIKSSRSVQAQALNFVFQEVPTGYESTNHNDGVSSSEEAEEEEVMNKPDGEVSYHHHWVCAGS